MQYIEVVGGEVVILKEEYTLNLFKELCSKYMEEAISKQIDIKIKITENRETINSVDYNFKLMEKKDYKLVVEHTDELPINGMIENENILTVISVIYKDELDFFKEKIQTFTKVFENMCDKNSKTYRLAIYNNDSQMIYSNIVYFNKLKKEVEVIKYDICKEQELI